MVESQPRLQEREIVMLYVPGGRLDQSHLKSPWYQLPISYNKKGYESISMSGKVYISPKHRMYQIETICRKGPISTLFEAVMGCGIITRINPDYLIVSPIGIYLPFV